MTRIRLGWRTRLDQISVAFIFLVLGAGLVLSGAMAGTSGWLTVPMIVIGVVFLLVVALRLLGWRSLRWPRELVVDDSGIGYETKGGDAFRISWADLSAVGVHSEEGVDERFGLVLVFFPKSGDFAEHLYSPVLVRLPRNSAVKVRLPRRPGVAEAVAQGAPRDWQRVPSTPWSALVTAPGVAPQLVPAPEAQPPVVVDLGRRTVVQALVGGVLAACVGAGLLTAAFTDSGAGVVVRVLSVLLGAPFALLALGLLLWSPMVARGRCFVLDADSFSLDDPSGEPFTLPWGEITSVAVETFWSRRAVGSFASRRRLDQVLVRTHERTTTVHLGSQRGSVDELARAVQRFAPRLWAGATTRAAGPFQVK
ncbi:hypothetical protein [Amycolatopsis sacchari]|uniref:hypothetical protein n=1 Tax=Amycolatopsis sacchari TaxID=115433 RepID=UPI003D74A8FA